MSHFFDRIINSTDSIFKTNSSSRLDQLPTIRQKLLKEKIKRFNQPEIQKINNWLIFKYPEVAELDVTQQYDIVLYLKICLVNIIRNCTVCNNCQSFSGKDGFVKREFFMCANQGLSSEDKNCEPLSQFCNPRIGGIDTWNIINWNQVTQQDVNPYYFRKRKGSNKQKIQLPPTKLTLEELREVFGVDTAQSSWNSDGNFGN